MKNNKPRSKIILEELRGEGNVNPISLTKVNPSPVASTQGQGEPYCSGRVVRQPECFISMGEVLEEPEINPCN